MRLVELEKRLNDERLCNVIEDGNILNYVSGDKVWVNASWHNMIDSFGIYFDGNKYCIFFTDHERGIPYLKKKFIDEVSACDYLYERVKTLKELETR